MNKTLAIFKNGKFVNPFETRVKGFKDMVSYLWGRKKVTPLTEHEKSHVHNVLPWNIEKLKEKYNHSTTIRTVWIGHATVLVQMEGYTFITDPVWSKHCTPTPNFPAGPARIRDTPCKISELPHIDFVLLSHNHYDHLDYDAVKELTKLQKPRWFVPKGMLTWFKNASVENVVELEWYQEYQVNDTITVVPTPCHHYSQRTLKDRYHALWCSWCVLGKEKRFWFSGDTAYCQVFKEIGQNYGPFDYAAIGIGAYDTNRDFMRDFHVSPDESIQIHKDIKSKRSLGIHWGTYILSDEPILEPSQLIKKYSLEEPNFKPLEFYTSKIGEIIDIIEDGDQNFMKSFNGDNTTSSNSDNNEIKIQ